KADRSRSPVEPVAFHVRRSSSRLSGEDWKLSWRAEPGRSGLRLFITNTCKQTPECSGRATRVGPGGPRNHQDPIFRTDFQNPFQYPVSDSRFRLPFQELVSVPVSTIDFKNCFRNSVSKSVNPKTISNYRSPLMIACPIFRILG